MSKPAVFRLDDFVVAEGQTDVPICIPKSPFRIHPDKNRTAGPVYLSRAGDEWWLVHPDVLDTYRVPRLWQAELFQGIWPDGRTFILPLTYPRPNCGGWFDTLQQAIQLARTQWITIESDSDQGCYLITPAKKAGGAIEWPECDFADVVEVAFDGHIILTPQEAMARLARNKGKRPVREEFVE